MRCIHTIPGEHLHMEGVGMPTVLFRGVNFGFWSHLGCSEGKAIIYSPYNEAISLRVSSEEI